MYCVQCGVELQKGVERCPLCSLRVYHPELKDTYEKTYLTFRFVKEDGKWKVAFAPVQHW